MSQKMFDITDLVGIAENTQNMLPGKWEVCGKEPDVVCRYKGHCDKVQCEDCMICSTIRVKAADYIAAFNPRIALAILNELAYLREREKELESIISKTSDSDTAFLERQADWLANELHIKAQRCPEKYAGASCPLSHHPMPHDCRRCWRNAAKEATEFDLDGNI